ncbi:hypothetical protein O3M35_007733 [Rhynocoris fuscipes]|uniref:Uncharacterized protein n=1 Tax=Rhynocoris fuscipes TaxID=488301 RepID=A0AAW1DFM9_9HEMI
MLPISKFYLCFSAVILLTASAHARVFTMQPLIIKSETDIPKLIIDDKSDNINLYEITMKSFLITVNSTVEKFNILSEKLIDEFPNLQKRVLDRIRNIEEIIPNGCSRYDYCDESKMQQNLNELEKCKEYLPKRENFIVSYEIISNSILGNLNNDKENIKLSLNSLIDNYNITKINYSLKLSESIYLNNNESITNWKIQAVNNLRQQEKDIWNKLQNLMNKINDYFKNINKFENKFYENLNKSMNSFICCAKSVDLSVLGISCNDVDPTTTTTSTTTSTTTTTVKPDLWSLFNKKSTPLATTPVIDEYEDEEYQY